MSPAEALGTAIVVIMMLYILVILISLGLGVLNIISMWKLFEKAGEPNWSAIVPVYNYIQMIKIATGDFKLAWAFLILWGGYFVIAMFTGIAGGIIESITDGSGMIMNVIAVFMGLIMLALYGGMIALSGYVSYMFPKSYGKSTAFCVLSIFFSPIMVIIMGFDKSTMYVGPKGIPQNNNYFYQNRF